MCECVLSMLCWLGNVNECCVVGVISCQGILLPHLIHYVLNNTTAQKEKRNIPIHCSTCMHRKMLGVCVCGGGGGSACMHACLPLCVLYFGEHRYACSFLELIFVLCLSV